MNPVLLLVLALFLNFSYYNLTETLFEFKNFLTSFIFNSPKPEFEQILKLTKDFTLKNNSNLYFVYPPREGATAQDGISDTMWRQEKDMTGKLLTKVKRQNKIMVEFKGNSKITRTD